MYDSNVIVGGDVNTIDTVQDRLSVKTDAPSSNLSKLKNFLNITDSWKSLHPNEKSFTFTDGSSRTAMSRIDYIFCNENVSNCLQKTYVKVAPVPDHKAVVIHLRSSKTSKGPGYRRLNSSAPIENKFKIGNKDVFKNTIEEYENINDKGLIWDLSKVRFK